MGTEAVLLATGPSLAEADVERVRLARDRRPDLKVVAINDAYRLAPWADVVYAADAAWWAHHAAEVRELPGELWTQGVHAGLGPKPAKAFASLKDRLNVVPSQRKDVPSFDPGVISQGGNSGFQAVNLAVLMGAVRVLLLGFDMGLGPDGERHFFGKHPPGLHMDSPYPIFIRAFERAAPVYAQRGIVILNASRRSALKCFRQVKLEAHL